MTTTVLNDLRRDLEHNIASGAQVTVHLSTGSTVVGALTPAPTGVASRLYLHVTASGGAVWRVPVTQVVAVVPA